MGISLCRLQTARVGSFFSLLLALVHTDLASPDCGKYRGKSARGLTLNHAQVLASHNSYHVGNRYFNYTHPPLDEQLRQGVRGFELDLFYDFVLGELRVLHVVGVDEGTTCKTLTECLAAAKAWSDHHPWHFPLFFQLELMGGIKKGTAVGGECIYGQVKPVAECAAQKCIGQAVEKLETCMIAQCLVEVLAANSANNKCQAMLPCLKKETNAIAGTPATPDFIFDKLRKCVGTGEDMMQRVDILASEQQVVAEKLKAALDSSFPSPRRISPIDVFTASESAQMAKYSHTPGSNNFWPLVDASRGKALFWSSRPQSAWLANILGPRRPLFVETVDLSVRKSDDPKNSNADGPTELVKKGVLTRTRSDVTEDAFSISRRDAALASGAFAISTDLFPTRAVAPAGFADWSGLSGTVAAQHVWIPSGTPVRCNPVTAAGVSYCTSAYLEDPGAMSCHPTTTTTTSTTTSLPGTSEVSSSDAGSHFSILVHTAITTALFSTLRRFA